MRNSLLLPGVFFLNFCFALLILSFFLGIAAYYEITPVESARGLILFLYIIKTGCIMVPTITLIAIMSVYHFLMRHPANMLLAIIIVICCLLIVVGVFIPVCYNLLPNIHAALAKYQTVPSADTVRRAFLSPPFFLGRLYHECTVLFTDLYAAYTRSYGAYLFLAGAIFSLVSSFWGACIATQWKMLNLMLLFFFFRLFVFLYPYTKSDFFAYITEILYFDIFRSSYGIPLILIIMACCIHTHNCICLWARSLKVSRQRRR